MQMLALPFILLLTYSEMFLRTYEMQSIYPFNGTRVAPAEAGEERLREVTFETPDGEVLILWVGAPEIATATILYLPGNAGNLATRVDRFSHFLDLGYGVVALAYRGSSGSSGRPNEAALSADALLVFDAVPSLAGTEDGAIILYGESLGTALATKIAIQRNADGVILEAPFTSIPDLAKIQYPDIDLSKNLTQIWDTAAIIIEMDEPLLILHGTEDRVVPFAQGQIVFELAGSARKWMQQLPGVGHHGLWTDDALAALDAFLDRI